MKRVISLIIVLSLSLVFNSCVNILNEHEQELYNKILGRWEIVTYTQSTVCFRGTCNIHIDLSDSLLLSNVYVEVINFKDDGFFNLEYNSGDIIQHRWFINQNSLWVDYYGQGNKTEIFQLTKTEFHFKILHSSDGDQFVIYELIK